MKPDILGFAASLKTDIHGAMHDILVRYILCKILRLVHRDEDVASWFKLFGDVLQSKSFLLIVIDGARYDVFKATYLKYLDGILHKAIVPPPHTYGWLPRVFSLPEFDNVSIFYAKLGIASHDIRIRDFVPRNRNIRVYVVEPRELRELGTVLPSEVNSVVLREGLCGRDIVWYVQPHFPWVCDRDLSLKLMREVLIHDYMPPDVVRRKLKALGVDRERIVKAYICNLFIALKGVRELLDIVKRFGIRYDRIVVTSDHGEMLGEYGLYLHQEYDLPQLTIVPWLEVEL